MAENPEFTHSFTIEYDDLLIKGDVEFNTDGKATFSINNHTGALSKTIIEKLDFAFRMIHDASDVLGEFQMIKILPKD